MKASIKFREETNQYPLFRAKVPLNVLTLPLQSSLSAGESKELTLNLSTFFKSGPSIKLAYRPNDPLNPFSLIIKTGTGPFGSPLSDRSPLLMSAEFNLVNKFSNPNPKFMLHFKPNFGDFTIKKSRGSEKVVRPVNGVVGLEEDPSIEMVEPVTGGKRMMGLSPATGAVTAGFVSGVFEGAEIAARTSLPVGRRARVNFRWGVRVPAEARFSMGGSGGWLGKVPVLGLNKIGIEYVDPVDAGKNVGNGKDGSGGDRVSDEGFYGLKNRVDVLQAENGMLRKAIEDLRTEFANAAGKSGSLPRGLSSGIGSEMDKNGGKGDRKSGLRTTEADVNEELKKALKGAAGASSSISR